jgi:hypothetical protein
MERGQPGSSAGAEAGKAALLPVIADEEARREVALAAHQEREQAAGAGAQFDDSDLGWRRRRDQAACDRRLLRVLEARRQRSCYARGSGCEGRRWIGSMKELAADPVRRIAGLLDRLSTVRAASVTHAANSPTEGPGRTGRCLPVAILALIASILCAGITAAFAAPAGTIGREFSYLRPRIPEGSCRSSLGLPASVVKESRDDFAYRLRSRR